MIAISALLLFSYFYVSIRIKKTNQCNKYVNKCIPKRKILIDILTLLDKRFPIPSAEEDSADFSETLV